MKPDISRRWVGGFGDLQQFDKPIVRCSIRFLSKGIPQAITFWNANGEGILIQSEMIDLKERVEVGVVVLSTSSALALGEIEIPGERFIGKALKPFSLVVEEAGHTIESGLCLRFGSDFADKLVVVAGACPYSIAIDGLTSLSVPRFVPEYPMERYSHWPVDGGRPDLIPPSSPPASEGIGADSSLSEIGAKSSEIGVTKSGSHGKSGS